MTIHSHETNVLINTQADVNSLFAATAEDVLELGFEPGTLSVDGFVGACFTEQPLHVLISRSDVLTPLLTAAEAVITQLPSLKANTASNGHLYDLKRAIEALIDAVEATK